MGQIIRSRHVVVISVLLLFITLSCEKPEGFGGTSEIKGVISELNYNDDYSVLVSQKFAVDEEVFIMFGDKELVEERLLSSATGAFNFKYLRPGDYTIYFKSEDSTTVERDEVVSSTTVSLAAGESIDLGTLKKYRTLDFDEGTSTLSGLVRLVNYKNSGVWPFLEVKDTSYAQEQEVYLMYGDHTYYDERIRTSYDGVFEFRNLIPGYYTVFVYSEDLEGGTESIPIIKHVTIDAETKNVDLGTFLIHQL